MLLNLSELVTKSEGEMLENATILKMSSPTLIGERNIEVNHEYFYEHAPTPNLKIETDILNRPSLGF